MDETNSGALAADFFATLVERLLLDFDDDDDDDAAEEDERGNAADID